MRTRGHEATEAIASHVAAALARFSMMDALQQTVRFNELFTGILGHDLRNPLGAMMTSASLALSRGGETLQKPLQRILSSGARMARMIDQLLDFTRVRVGGGIPVEPATLELNALVRRILDEHVDATEQGRFDLATTGDVLGQWDGDRLAQALSNLVGNALQHGEPKEPIRLAVSNEGDAVRIEVRSGGTIPAEVLPTLFEPLGGGSKPRVGRQGLGLGLFIARQIVEAHRGTIDVVSNEQAGTCFSIVLPRSPSTQAP